MMLKSPIRVEQALSLSEAPSQQDKRFRSGELVQLDPIVSSHHLALEE
jgi:hypothetical protein